MRAPTAVLFLLTAASACATGSEIWLIPQVMVQPGSPVVVISNSKLRSVEPSGGSGWFGGATTNRGMDIKTVAWSYQTLDVRTCKAGPLHKFTQSVDAVGWGTAPGELWVRSPDDSPIIRPLEGAARLELGTARGRSPGEPLPVRSGVAFAPGLLRVWNLDTRSIRDLPWPSEPALTKFFSPRPGDDTLVGIVDSDGKSINVVAVPLSEGSSPPVTRTFEGPYSARQARLVRRGTWLALTTGSVSRDGTLDLVDLRAGKRLARVPVASGDSWTLVDGEPPRLARLADPSSCQKLEIVDLETGAATDVPLPGCATGLRAWGEDTPFVIAGVEPVANFAVDVRTRRAARLAAGVTGGDLVGSAFYSAELGRQELLAVDPASGRRWTAATDAEPIRSVVGVPAARKVVIVDERQRILTFDVDTHRIQVCQVRPALPRLVETARGAAGLRVEIAEDVVGIGDRLDAVVVRLVPDRPELRFRVVVGGDQGLEAAELEELLLHHPVVVLPVGLLQPVDGEVEEQLIGRAFMEARRQPLVLAHALVRNAPDREMSERVLVPAQESVGLRRRDEGVERECPIAGDQRAVERPGQAQQLRRSQEPPEQQPAEERFRVDVRDAVIVAKEVVGGPQVILGARARAAVVDLRPVVAVRVGSVVDETTRAEDELAHAVNHAVHEVHVARCDVAADRVLKVVEPGVLLVVDLHEGLRGNQTEGELRQDADRAERAVHHLEQESVVAVGAR